MKEQHSSHLQKIGACLHQLLHLRINAHDQQKGLE